jgi:uncharacterized protein (DUF885 family)
MLITSCTTVQKAPPSGSAVATGPVSAGVTDPAETARFNLWLDGQFAQYLDFSPLAKTRLGDKSDYDKLDDVSDDMDDKRLAWRRTSVAEMRRQFNREALTTQGQLSWDLWEYLLARSEQWVPFRHHGYVFGRFGEQTSLVESMINYHKVDTLADFNAYVSRLNQAHRYLGQYLEKAKLAAAIGVRSPYFGYDVATTQIEAILTGEPFTDAGVSPLWADVNRKLDQLRKSGAIVKLEADELAELARSALLTSIKPGYEEILQWLKADRINAGETARGVSELPNGDAYYDYQLATMTTLPISAEEIHQLGLKEVTRIHREMELIKKRVGFDGTLTDFFAFVRTDPQFYLPNTDAGRADYLALANTYLGEMKTRLPDYFGRLPKADLVVRRVEAFREQPGAAAHYNRGTPDGSRPGVFYVHLADMNAVTTYMLEALAYHEGLPGHHLQISIQQELEGIPRFRTYHGYTAYSEGWGLYAELLAREMGAYQDPYSDFGRLTSEIWRAVRLVVDTGIHAKHWTEEQAVHYALMNSSRPEASVRSEVQRYFSYPGQATSYKIGMLKILELRDKARTALGDKFDIRGFHDVVIGNGALPLPLLEALVDRWIEELR